MFSDKFSKKPDEIKTTAGTENNKNIIDAIFGNLPAQQESQAAPIGNTDTERDRRLRLRELERLRRVVGAPAVDAGKYYPKEGEGNSYGNAASNQ